MEQIFIFSCIAGALAIIYGFITAKQVLGMSAGTKKMQEISNAIQEGASAYLKRQYYTIALVGVIIFIIIAFFLNLSVALGFLVGAILSGMAGFIGMHLSKRLLDKGFEVVGIDNLNSYYEIHLINYSKIPF